MVHVINQPVTIWSSSILADPGSEAILDSLSLPADPGVTVHPLDTWSALRRYLLIGGIDRVLADPLPITIADSEPVRTALAEDSLRVVAEVLAATAGGPSRPEPLLLALALAASADDDLTRRAALTALPRVARSSRDLFLFATFVQSLRGWGRGLRRAVGSWYNDRSPEDLVEDVLSTPGFAGWRHADLLRLGHPKAPTMTHDAIYRWVVTGVSPPAILADPTVPDAAPLLARLAAATALSDTRDGSVAAELIATHRLPLATVPESLRRESSVWEALLPHLRPTELLSALPTLAAIGCLVPSNPVHELVRDRLTHSNANAPRRFTPLAVVAARHAYEVGHSTMGRWDVDQRIMEALGRAFDFACLRIETGDQPITLRIPAGTCQQATTGGTFSALDLAATIAIVLSPAGSFARIEVVGEVTLTLRLLPGAGIDEAVAAISRLAARAGSSSVGQEEVTISVTRPDGGVRAALFGGPFVANRRHSDPNPSMEAITIQGMDSNLVGTIFGLLQTFV